MLARLSNSVVILIDVQPSFLAPIVGAEHVLGRCKFMLEIAALLDVPVIATEQYPSRMGGTHEDLIPLLRTQPVGKMCFSCGRSQDFNSALEATGRRQAILIGIETPICVNQTAHDLLGRKFEVLIAADAVGARSAEMHHVALRRMAAAGAILAQTDSIAYEWLETAEHPKFREALAIVKAAG
jgi:nicotinamidase-related amidase